MQFLRVPVVVIMQRTPLANRWSDEQWAATAVEFDDEATGAHARCMGEHGSGTRWRCPGLEVELHRVEAEGYYLNVSTSEPKAFVLWRMAEPGEVAEPRARPLIVTLSYSEAARFLDAGEQVDAVPMPAAMLAALRAFVAAYYRPEPHRKVKRNELYEESEARHGEPHGGAKR